MKRLKKLFKSIGPGFITGASDDDPAGIATYSQTGAQFGFSQTWTALFSFPLMTAVQEMCGRIGMVTGKGLAGVIRQHYTRFVLYPTVFLLIVANTINIGADLGAMATALHLVIKLPFFVWLSLVVLITLALQIFIPYKTYAKYLKYLTLALFSYVATAFFVRINWTQVAAFTFIPQISMSKDYLLNIVAIFGTTISPYLFFWQASEEVEEEVAENKLDQMGAGTPKITNKDIARLRFDTIFGMLFSNVVMFFIIITTGATLYTAGISQISSAEQAASAIRPFAGDFAFLLFTLGIVGTGFLAVPVLAGSASYAVSETFHWKEGLYKKFKHAQGFYLVIAAATFVGYVLNFFNINPMTALYYSAVVNGLIAPPLLIVIFMISNNKDILNSRTNNVLQNILCILTIIIMSLAAIALLGTFFIK